MRPICAECLRFLLILFLAGTAAAKLIAFVRGDFSDLDANQETAILMAAVGEAGLAVLLAVPRTAAWAAWLAAFAFLGAGAAALLLGAMDGVVIQCNCLGVLPVQRGWRLIVQGGIVLFAVCYIGLRDGGVREGSSIEQEAA